MRRDFKERVLKVLSNELGGHNSLKNLGNNWYWVEGVYSKMDSFGVSIIEGNEAGVNFFISKDTPGIHFLEIKDKDEVEVIDVLDRNIRNIIRYMSTLKKIYANFLALLRNINYTDTDIKLFATYPGGGSEKYISVKLSQTVKNIQSDSVIKFYLDAFFEGELRNRPKNSMEVSRELRIPVSQDENEIYKTILLGIELGMDHELISSSGENIIRLQGCYKFTDPLMTSLSEVLDLSKVFNTLSKLF